MPNRLSRLMSVALCAAVVAGCGHSGSTAPGATSGSGSTGGGGAAAAKLPDGTVGAAIPVVAKADSQSEGECVSQARTALGQDAEVLKCGFLNEADVLESVAIVRKPLAHKPRDAFAARLVILRKGKSGWTTALDVSQGTRNDVGYIATDFLDDDLAIWGYRVKLHGTLPDGQRRFTVEVAPMHDARDKWAVGTEISWDKRVGRYREYNVDQEGFQPENRNPPHVHKGASSAPAAGTRA